MNARQLIEELSKIDPTTEIMVSIDVSTGEEDQDLRAFSDEFYEVISDGAILFGGYLNESTQRKKDEQPEPKCKTCGGTGKLDNCTLSNEEHKRLSDSGINPCDDCDDMEMCTVGLPCPDCNKPEDQKEKTLSLLQTEIDKTHSGEYDEKFQAENKPEEFKVEVIFTKEVKSPIDSPAKVTLSLWMDLDCSFAEREYALYISTNGVLMDHFDYIDEALYDGMDDVFPDGVPAEKNIEIDLIETGEWEAENFNRYYEIIEARIIYPIENGHDAGKE